MVQLGQNSPEVFVCTGMYSIVMKMLTISSYFWTTESPVFGFTRLTALCYICGFKCVCCCFVDRIRFVTTCRCTTCLWEWSLRVVTGRTSHTGRCVLAVMMWMMWALSQHRHTASATFMWKLDQHHKASPIFSQVQYIIIITVVCYPALNWHIFLQ